MRNKSHHNLFAVIPVLALIGVLQACGGEEEAAAGGSGFGDCLTPDQGFSSCDQYCASRSRACANCGCPADHSEDYLCIGKYSGSQYSAIGWKASPACEGSITTVYDGCTQDVFRDSTGAVTTMSVKCCCE